jgi:hypothetical protein
MHALLASAYVWTQIVIPGATVLQAFGLNDKGQTAVTTTDGRTGIYRHGTFILLAAPLPGYQVTAQGINDAGVVIGFASTNADPHEQGFILVGSVYKFFSRLGWQNTEPRAIGNSGLVTGYSFQDTGESAGFVYHPMSGVFTDATPPGSTDTFVYGINKYGRISGHGRQPGLGPGRYAFVWQQGTIADDDRELVPFLDRIKIGIGSSAARGINDAGLIVGFGSGKGFVGSDARGYQALVPPGGDAAGNSSFCEGINNDAQVVCAVSDAAGNPLGAFIGSPREED